MPTFSSHVVMSITNGSSIPNSDIVAVRSAVGHKVANVPKRRRTVTTAAVENQEGDKMPLTLSHKRA